MLKNSAMDCYGLIGFPLTHSFSAQFFTDKFKHEGIDAKYLNFEIKDIDEITKVILSNQFLRGLNVTIPYKEKVIPFLHKLSPVAEKIGAVNTIKIDRVKSDSHSYEVTAYNYELTSHKYELTGYNTDYIGFKDSLIPLIYPDVQKKALILGTGGASKAVSQALIDMSIEVTYVSRSARDGQLSYNDLTPDIISSHKLIVNTTPLGTYPNVDNYPDLPYSLLTKDHLLYDLVYNPSETLFLSKGKERGAIIKNGREMLELQALAAWEIYGI